jgi:hypothetical protein
VFEPPEGFWALAREPGASAAALRPARDYLAGRGVGAFLIREAAIGACAVGPLQDRVVVPLRSDEGHWLWWIARSIHTGVSKKYMYPSGSRRGLIYNHMALFVETDVPALVVEGCFDTFPYWPDAVALLGNATPEHLLALSAARRPICVVLDGDAWEKGAALALQLRLNGQRAGCLRLPPKKDPDEMCVEEIRHLAGLSLNS